MQHLDHAVPGHSSACQTVRASGAHRQVQLPVSCQHPVTDVAQQQRPDGAGSQFGDPLGEVGGGIRVEDDRDRPATQYRVRQHLAQRIHTGTRRGDRRESSIVIAGYADQHRPRARMDTRYHPDRRFACSPPATPPLDHPEVHATTIWTAAPAVDVRQCQNPAAPQERPGTASATTAIATGRAIFDTISLYEEALHAATASGDPCSQATPHGSLGTSFLFTGRTDEARSHHEIDLDICRERGDRCGEQRALGDLGMTHIQRKRPDEAIPHLERQLVIATRIDAQVGRSFALTTLGQAHHQLGNSDHAITMVEKGMVWYEQTGDYLRLCDSLELLARVHIDLGQLDRAVELLYRELAHARRHEYRYGEIWALTYLAKSWQLSDDTAKARHYAEQAVTVSQNLDHHTKIRQGALDEYAKLH
jgi:hypothetical protein